MGNIFASGLYFRMALALLCQKHELEKGVQPLNFLGGVISIKISERLWSKLRQEAVVLQIATHQKGFPLYMTFCTSFPHLYLYPMHTNM